MIPIYMRPRTSKTHTTLQASVAAWEEAIDILAANNQMVYIGLIAPHLKDKDNNDTVRLTFTNTVAVKLLHFFGVSA